MAFSWTQEQRAEDKGYNKALAQFTDRENRIAETERSQAKRDIELELLDNRLTALNKQHDDIEVLTNTAKLELAQALFELEKSNFEMTKAGVANDALLLEKRLAEQQRAFDAKLALAIDQTTEAQLEEKIALKRDAVIWEESSNAKDIVIYSKNEEIARLDELLKVTMGKLTQIDVKGLTIHVENEHKYTGKEKE